MKRYIQSLLFVLTIFGVVPKVVAQIAIGSWVVTILPAGAVAAGARWQADGQTNLYQSGQFFYEAFVIPVGDLGPHIHNVTFTTISGWTSPANQQVAVYPGPTTLATGTYVQIVPAPTLTAKLSATNTMIVSWPSPSTGYNLQQNNDLTTTNWVTPSESVMDNGTNKYIIVSPPTGKRFFRLKNP